MGSAMSYTFLMHLIAFSFFNLLASPAWVASIVIQGSCSESLMLSTIDLSTSSNRMLRFIVGPMAALTAFACVSRSRNAVLRCWGISSLMPALPPVLARDLAYEYTVSRRGSSCLCSFDWDSQYIFSWHFHHVPEEDLDGWN